MKAAVYHGIEDMRVEEIKQPICKAGEIMIKVHYCAICGTDVRIYFSGHKKVVPPAVIGHEISGTVAEIGREVEESGLKVGDKVTVVTSMGCENCKMCDKGLYNLCPDTKALGYFYPGGFAEYIIVPEAGIRQKSVLNLPAGVSMKEGALIEALSCVINGQNYLDINQGDTVVIYGGGPIGLMHAVLAHASGADNVIVSDPAYDRLERFGRQFEGLILIDPTKVTLKEEVMKLTGGYGADVVITACPSPQAQVEGLEILGSKGRISLFGGLPKNNSVITIDANIIHYKEISVFGAFASNRKDYLKASDLIASHKIDAEKFISAVLPLEKINEGISMVKNGQVLKCLMEIGG